MKITQGQVIEVDARKCAKCRQRADAHVWKCTDCGRVFDGELRPAGQEQCACKSTMVAAHCKTWPATLFWPAER